MPSNKFIDSDLINIDIFSTTQRLRVQVFDSCYLSRLWITATPVRLNPSTYLSPQNTSRQRCASPISDKISHLPPGQRRARRTRPAVPRDTCPCSPGSVACCSRPVTRSPLPAAPPALASLRLLPESGSRWGYYHWSMSEGMKEGRG